MVEPGLEQRAQRRHRAVERRGRAPAALDQALLGGEAADFLFVSALDGRPAEAYRPLAEEARARDLPMVCSNPDRQSPTPAGLQDTPGALAAIYASLGGRVIYVGKPYAPIYVCLTYTPT